MSFLQERGETDFQVYQENMLQGVVKHLNMTLFSSCPKGQANSGVAAEEPSSLHQRRELACGECRRQNPRLKLWAVLEDMLC